MRAPTSGDCGPNAKWSYNENTGTLAISGTGEMVFTGSNLAPWYSYRNAIKSVVFSGSVTSIGSYAFHECESLSSITIPSTVTSIGSNAFCDCVSLKSITIPKDVNSISSGLFAGCTNLSSIKVASGSTSFKSVNGVLFNKGGYILMAYPCGKHGSYDIPDDVTMISESAFSGCVHLTSVTIPNTVSSIGSYAFNGCSSLTDVHIPAGVTNIGTSPFKLCSNLISIEVDSKKSAYRSVGGVLMNKGETKLIEYPCGKAGSYTIPDSVKSIEREAFYGSGRLTSLIIPASVASIGPQTFYECEKLEIISYLGTSNPCASGNSFGSTSPNVICVTNNYQSNDFCGKTDFCKRGSCDDMNDIDNHCFSAYCVNKEWLVQKRENATEWEKGSNECYEYQCDNSTGGIRLRVNHSEWESHSNECYEYQCNDETFEPIIKLRANHSEWESRSNECYEYQCVNGSAQLWQKGKLSNCCVGTVKEEVIRRWKSLCIEHECNDDGELLLRSKCKSSNAMNRTCINGECIEGKAYEEKQWSAEIETDNITIFDIDPGVLIDEFNEDLIVGTIIDENEHVVTIIIYVDDEKTANALAERVKICSSGF